MRNAPQTQRMRNCLRDGQTLALCGVARPNAVQLFARRRGLRKVGGRRFGNDEGGVGLRRSDYRKRLGNGLRGRLCADMRGRCARHVGNRLHRNRRGLAHGARRRGRNHGKCGRGGKQIRAVLRARPVLAQILVDRRKHRVQRGRTARAQIRHDARKRARTESGACRRPRGIGGIAAEKIFGGNQPARHFHRLGGHARNRNGGVAETASAPEVAHGGACVFQKRHGGVQGRRENHAGEPLALRARIHGRRNGLVHSGKTPRLRRARKLGGNPRGIRRRRQRGTGAEIRANALARSRRKSFGKSAARRRNLCSSLATEK